MRVPAYSPNAVAEHTLALILALNRNIHRAYNRVRDRNFALSGLVGFDLAGKTAGVVGTGRIGTIVARLLWHLRCRVLAVDMYEVRRLPVMCSCVSQQVRGAPPLLYVCVCTGQRPGTEPFLGIHAQIH